MQPELPDYIVWNYGYQGAPAYTAFIFDKDRPEPLIELEVHASWFVPRYLLYQSVVGRGEGGHVRRLEIEPRFADAVAVVERVLAERFGLTRFPAELARLPVPDIITRDVALGQATLADALFGLDPQVIDR